MEILKKTKILISNLIIINFIILDYSSIFIMNMIRLIFITIYLKYQI